MWCIALLCLMGGTKDIAMVMMCGVAIIPCYVLQRS